MTVEDFFDDLLISKINLKKLCRECDGTKDGCDICFVKSRYLEIVEKLKDELKILPSEDEEKKPSYFLTGSYRRHTMISPPKDVDLFIVLDSGEYQDEELGELIRPKVLLKKLKRTLEYIFENTSMTFEIQNHSIKVIYDASFSIDVVPAFETDDKKSYMIPNVSENTERYIISNPKTHFEYINNINGSTSIDNKKRFKKIVRLLKYVKREKLTNLKIRSMHFEFLAAETLGKNKIKSHSEGLSLFLFKASLFFNKPSIKDPANPDNKIDDYIKDFIPEIKESIKKELDSLGSIAKKALYLETSGNVSEAITEWEKIFSKNGSSENSDSETTIVNLPPLQPWCSS